MDVDEPPVKPEASASIGADPDPIVASYNVYTNPTLPTNRKLLILQHPNKANGGTNSYAQLREVRIKPRSGMLEVDVPISHAHADYDRDKGQRWGGALAKSAAAKSGGTQGLAGGFGVGVPASRGGSRRRGGDDYERQIDMLDWAEAVRQDTVLRTQTLGGQLPRETGVDCRWMVGVFKGDQLHLTPATALIQLRPQLHHLDALAEQDRRAASNATGKDAPAAPPAAARAIHMSIKSAGSGSGEMVTETMADRLRGVQMESWSKLKYDDEESDKAWDLFHGNLLYKGAKSQETNKDEDSKDKGKGKAPVSIMDLDDVNDPQQLKVQWGSGEYLRMVSGMKDGPDGGEQPPEVSEIKKEEEDAPAASGAAKKTTAAKGKARATPAKATPAAAKKTANSKGKSVAFKGTTAMDIDK
ncbi:Uu.00g054090.m01.CDS01 [Anthostomella pinea]|uniref:Uu.00g054090.m01.CDS01 n=1 Tax=Anthostomella pinea TaxID=933095 RepID=A0AAI8YPH0_9PEZI|nr:Uu.00g054090.m01.CDS01 [Anthostomella pinea]